MVISRYQKPYLTGRENFALDCAFPVLRHIFSSFCRPESFSCPVAKDLINSYNYSNVVLIMPVCVVFVAAAVITAQTLLLQCSEACCLFI